jgi:hypothetical protein
MNGYCVFAECDFTAEDTDNEYSADCRNCGRRDPMAGLVLASMERRQDALDSLDNDWTNRDDGDYTYADESGNRFYIRVLPASISNGKPYMLLQYVGGKCRVAASFESIIDAVLRAQNIMRDARLSAAGVPDAPPF